MIALVAVVADSLFKTRFLAKEGCFVHGHGLWGMIRMDWLALLAASLFDLLLVAPVAQLITWRLRHVPNALGVLQQ